MKLILNILLTSLLFGLCSAQVPSGNNKVWIDSLFQDHGGTFEASYGNVQVDDTLALQQLNMDEGRVANLKQLSSTNPYGGGKFVVMDSASIDDMFYQLDYGEVLFEHLRAGLIWVRQEFLETRAINVLWCGSYPDSSNYLATADGGKRAAWAAYSLQTHAVYFPQGVFWFNSDFMRCFPNQTIRGAGVNLTKITKGITGDSLSLIYGSSEFDSSKYFWDEHDIYKTPGIGMGNLYISDMTLEGSYGFDPDSNASASSAGGIATGGWPSRGAGDPELDSLGWHYGRWRNQTFERLALNRFNIAAIYFAGKNVTIRDVTAVSNNFTLFSGQGNHVVFDKIRSDSCKQWGEVGSAINWIGDGDSTTTFSVRNVINTNGYGYGINFNNGDYISISDFYWSNQFLDNPEDYGVSGYAFWFRIHTANANSHIPLGNVSVRNGEVRHVYSLAYIQPRGGDLAAYDSTMNNIIIDNVIAEDMGHNAVTIITDKDAQSYSIGATIIQNCTLINWNGEDSPGLEGVHIEGVDSAVVRNNTIYTRKPTANGFALSPVEIIDSKNAIIHNNDFRIKGGTSAQKDLQGIVVCDTLSMPVLLYNNQGTRKAKALLYYAVDGYRYHYQSEEVTPDGLLIGKNIYNQADHNDWGMLHTTILDTSCIVRYDDTGTAVDTTRIAPTR